MQAFVKIKIPVMLTMACCFTAWLVTAAAAAQSPAAGDGITSSVVILEGPFGRADVDLTSPSLTALYLRGPDGKLTERSLLAIDGIKPCYKGGYTYVVGHDGRRYESYRVKPQKVELGSEDGRTKLTIRGIMLQDDKADPVADEDWTLFMPGDGGQLIWKIVRRWHKSMDIDLTGDPGLFYCFDPREYPRSPNTILDHIMLPPM